MNSELNHNEEEKVVTIHHPLLEPLKVVIPDEKEMKKELKKKMDIKAKNILTFLKIN